MIKKMVHRLFLTGFVAFFSSLSLMAQHKVEMVPFGDMDQWDWERVITNEDRNVEFLKEIVNRIYAAMIRTEYMVYEMYPLNYNMQRSKVNTIPADLKY